MIAIGVPVRDEEERLPRLLHALADQRGAPPFRLCLFLDGCTDGSAALVAALSATLPYRIVSDRTDRAGPPNAGLARARAMALALAAAPDGILLTTDADGAPATDWIAANLAALASADVVAGRIVRGAEPPSRRQDRIDTYYAHLYRARRAIDPIGWEPDPAHHWTSGASLALRAATYRALGGIAPLANGEDAALCDAAERAGLRVRRDAAVLVRTSARRRGRADGGFAAALAQLDRGDDMPMTTHPEDEMWRFRMQAEARSLHGRGDYASFSARLGLPPQEVEQVAAECRNGAAFAARIVGPPPGGARMVRFDDAERILVPVARVPAGQPTLSNVA
ncbi:glycosyltransferase [Sphingomonas profundi]|uniref:glycosyltransferase n=1 Tax=Alterirhizorhabdus profundi TaxID=2681549 RepID=UPI0012E856F4|nr:glycosyltransferase [Sphingomonas profundi]